MGTIVERRRKDGTVAYMAQIALMRQGKSHREARTFDRRPAAAAWLKKREKELADPTVFAAAGKPKGTIGDAIDAYLRENAGPIGRTKAQVLRTLKTFDIADIAAADLRSADVVALAADLRKTRKPQTVANYLAHFGAVLAIARPAWGYEIPADAMKDAMLASRRLGLSGKSISRDRRPTLGELDALMAHFEDARRRRPSMLPMTAIIAFAIYSTRRLEEITRIRWADLDRGGSRVLVRDMKHPGQKVGNDVWCDLSTEAMRIIDSLPKEADTIFVAHGQSVSAAFTRACAFLGIADLHFHDLRHEGVSRLFEMGLSIPRVAAVSGHRSWASLQRYTHLRQVGDKFAQWPWLGAIASA